MRDRVTGNAPSAMRVGALDSKGTVTHQDDTVASYSSKGPTWYDGLARPICSARSPARAWHLHPIDVVRQPLQRPSRWGRRRRQEYLRLSGTIAAAAARAASWR